VTAGRFYAGEKRLYGLKERGKDVRVKGKELHDWGKWLRGCYRAEKK